MAPLDPFSLVEKFQSSFKVQKKIGPTKGERVGPTDG